MARSRRSNDEAINEMPMAMTPEDREDQLILLATNLAEERLRSGTASNQLIAEILRLGTTKERLQKEKLQRENELLRAKTSAMESQKRGEIDYKRVLDALRSYGGRSGVYDEYDEEDEDVF